MKTVLVWLDVETTGLDPELDVLLAIGVILTTPALQELGRGEWCVELPRPLWMAENVLAMHTSSGLLDRCGGTGRPLVEVERDVRELVLSVEADRRYLAGNSIGFDRSFLARHAPTLLELVHYRVLDVSTLKVLGELWLDETVPRATPAHTPLADLEASLAELRHWQSRMFKEGIGP